VDFTAPLGLTSSAMNIADQVGELLTPANQRYQYLIQQNHNDISGSSGGYKLPE
jgi:hypothetical protein